MFNIFIYLSNNYKKIMNNVYENKKKVFKIFYFLYR